MKALIYILGFCPLVLFSQNEISKPERTTYYLFYDSTANVYHAGITKPNQVTTSGQPSQTVSVSETEFIKLTKDIPVEYDTLPPVGEFVFQGIYTYNDSLIICRQDHLRTQFPPRETPALFVVYRPEGDNYLQWAVGEIVYPGQIRRYNGNLYECIQQHLTIVGQTPDLLPAIWNSYSDEECPQWVQPTGAQDAYNVGDCVKHKGQEWISTTPANVWEPGIFGWELKNK